MSGLRLNVYMMEINRWRHKQRLVQCSLSGTGLWILVPWVWARSLNFEFLQELLLVAQLWLELEGKMYSFSKETFREQASEARISPFLLLLSVLVPSAMGDLRNSAGRLKGYQIISLCLHLGSCSPFDGQVFAKWLLVCNLLFYFGYKIKM